LTLLEPHVTRVGQPDGSGTEDRLDDRLAAGTPREPRDAPAALIGEEQVHGRAIDLVRYASDASPYRLVPEVVVTPRDVADVVAVLNFCRESGRHATFRAGGTSLNGQSQGDGVLIDLRRHWYGMSIEDEGAALRARPGTTLGHAARFLEMHGRRVGTDSVLFELEALTRPETQA
jgi:D-lactate dehydrogenase